MSVKYTGVKEIRAEGSKGIIHKLRGKKSNRGYTEELKEKVIGIYRARYSDYGPTLFREQLVENYNIALDHDTIRRWMRENNNNLDEEEEPAQQDTGSGEVLRRNDPV